MDILCNDEYSLTFRNIFNILENIPKTSHVKRKEMPIHGVNNKTPKKIESFFTPIETDSLFWCWVKYFIGNDTYEIERHHPFKYEQKLKIELIHIIRENKSKLKQYKIKANQIETNLMDKIINIETFFAFTILNNFNFLYLSDKVYYENVIEKENKTVVVKEIMRNKKYSILVDDTFNVEQLKQKRLLIEKINKPLKPIAKYKLKELQEICTKFNIPYLNENNKNLKKKDLYKKIQEIIY